MTTDFERLLRESVHDLASEGRPVDLGGPALRRADRIRTVRAVSAVSAVVVAVMLVAGVAAAVRIGRADRDVPPADPVPSTVPSTAPSATLSAEPTESGDPEESEEPRTPPILVAGGWMIRAAPNANDTMIVYDDAAGRYRRAGTSATALPSPDGRYLAVVGQTAIIVTTVADKRVVYERNAIVTGVRPVWSPDSTRLAFATFSPEGVKVRVAEVAVATETASDTVNCPDGCMLKWLEDGGHIRVYTGSQRAEVTIRGGAVGRPSATRDDPCGSTVRAFRIDASSWICVTGTGFAITTGSGAVTGRIPFPTEIAGIPVAGDCVNFVLSRGT
ncbi:PD40 domain-containing protein [Virgisporangium ochraceum]|uniref:Uncharacterized protein n=1 Tax=Virgisporangium ochraceum TaxID=65505 RepID=A0A8J4A346_9ACTN|nr:PD40 domain-containing protein [Virgisporangium ochraceum]GIJ74251.1 hypothetical protein Voc01_091680 [Virgisporangium ochraceum]